jgi:hypothetical protein
MEMAKNFAAIFNGGNDSSALNQSFFLKVETVRGQMAFPVGADFLFSLGGGGVNFSQPFESSPHRSGRHNNNIIKQKTTTEWSLPTFINIKQGVAYGLAYDSGIKLLWKAMLGKEVDSSGYIYDSANDPSVTFSLFENLDHMAKQAIGCFVNQVEIQLPGDGQAQLSWSGNGKTVVHAGIAKSIVANAANTFTCTDPALARRFDVGSAVMIVKNDGVTRSADTPTPRTVTAVDTTTGVVTVSGAVLADADGTVNPVYLCYWEPTTPAGIDEPQTGLVGSVSIDSLPTLSCVRGATISLNNNHELVDYCYGTDGLSGPLFVAGGRLEAMLSLEMNLNAPLVEFMQRVREFEAHDVQLVCGPATGRRLQIDLPRVIFSVPSIAVPDTGSIPVSFEGTALQQSLDSADEITISLL